MSLMLRCQCGQRYRAKPEFAGKRIECRKCGQLLRVPKSGAFPAGAEKPDHGIRRKESARSAKRRNRSRKPEPLPAAPPVPPSAEPVGETLEERIAARQAARQEEESRSLKEPLTMAGLALFFLLSSLFLHWGLSRVAASGGGGSDSLLAMLYDVAGRWIPPVVLGLCSLISMVLGVLNVLGLVTLMAEES